MMINTIRKTLRFKGNLISHQQQHHHLCVQNQHQFLNKQRHQRHQRHQLHQLHQLHNHTPPFLQAAVLRRRYRRRSTTPVTMKITKAFKSTTTTTIASTAAATSTGATTTICGGTTKVLSSDTAQALSMASFQRRPSHPQQPRQLSSSFPEPSSSDHNNKAEPWVSTLNATSADDTMPSSPSRSLSVSRSQFLRWAVVESNNNSLTSDDIQYVASLLDTTISRVAEANQLKDVGTAQRLTCRVHLLSRILLKYQKWEVPAKKFTIPALNGEVGGEQKVLVPALAGPTPDGDSNLLVVFSNKLAMWTPGQEQHSITMSTPQLIRCWLDSFKLPAFSRPAPRPAALSPNASNYSSSSPSKSSSSSMCPPIFGIQLFPKFNNKLSPLRGEKPLLSLTANRLAQLTRQAASMEFEHSVSAIAHYSNPDCQYKLNVWEPQNEPDVEWYREQVCSNKFFALVKRDSIWDPTNDLQFYHSNEYSDKHTSDNNKQHLLLFTSIDLAMEKLIEVNEKSNANEYKIVDNIKLSELAINSLDNHNMIQNGIQIMYGYAPVTIGETDQSIISDRLVLDLPSMKRVRDLILSIPPNLTRNQLLSDLMNVQQYIV